MTTATVIQFYATADEADIFLELKEDWLDLDTEVKEDALLSARFFIDSNFNCIVDYSKISEEVKYASSLLAYDYFTQGDLFFSNKKSVKIKKIKAKTVTVETEYGYAKKDRPNSLDKVIAVLLPICRYSKKRLVRV